MFMPSQYNEDLFLNRFFSKESGNLIIDVGAYDGTTNSVSLEFIKLGWDAILIEPNPYVFPDLINLHKENSKVKCIDVIISDFIGTSSFYLDKNDKRSQCCTASFDDFLIKRLSLNPEEINEGDYINLQCTTLTKLLKDLDVTKQIQILSIDAEGGDYEVLLGLDFSIFKPYIIITEDYLPKDKQKNSLLLKNGYKKIAKMGNSIWKLE
jgi:FkbM family methyltransferase